MKADQSCLERGCVPFEDRSGRPGANEHSAGWAKSLGGSTQDWPDAAYRKDRSLIHCAQIAAREQAPPTPPFGKPKMS
jgi:hypothetical protein